MNEILPLTVLDKIFLELKKFPEADMPVKHRFTPHLYIREIFMPAGTMVISRIHKYEHPFVISKGEVIVWQEDGSKKFYRAPHTGITKPGTQRILYIGSDTIWTTFHVTDLTDHEEIVETITAAPDEHSITISENAMKQLKNGAKSL